jgi:hypothetical protein
MRTCRIALAAALCLLLAACQTFPFWGQPPFQATWYLIEDEPSPPGGLYIAVVNQSASRQTITSVSLNGEGWSVAGLPQTLEPGQVLVRHQSKFTPNWGECRIPVLVTVDQGKEGGKRKIKPMGSFPSAMPAKWLNCPPP